MAATASEQPTHNISSKTHIHELTDDCLLLVLRSLGHAFHKSLPIRRQPHEPIRVEHPLQCALVCKRWRTLADSAVPTLQLRDVDEANAAHVSRRFVRLAALKVTFRISHADVLPRLADGTPNLESLKLKCYIPTTAQLPPPPPLPMRIPPPNPLSPPPSIPAFVQNLTRWASLRCLTLSRPFVMKDSEEAEEMVDALCQLQSLQHLCFGFRRATFRHPLDPVRVFARAEALTGLLTLQLTCSPAVPPVSSGLFPRVLRKLHLDHFNAPVWLPESLGCYTGLVALSIKNSQGHTTLPESLGRLSCLTKLQVRTRVTWPESTSSLQALRILKVDGAPPEGLGLLTSLERVSVNGLWNRQMENLGDLSDLRNLLTLELRRCNKISALPDSIGCLSRLQVLKLDNLPSLAVLPSALGMLTALEELEVRWCPQLGALPDSLRGLSSLQRCCICSLPLLSRLPQDIFGEWRALTKLTVSACRLLTELPDTLGGLCALRELLISECDSLVSLPQSLGALTSLNVLSVRMCKRLVQMPESSAELSALKELRIGDCKLLVSLPASLGGLTGLQILSVDRCKRLRELPELSCLEKLHVHECRALVSLPQSIRSRPVLRKLSVGHCKRLRGLSGTIKELPALRELALSGGSQTGVLRVLGTCTGLRELDLEGLKRCSRLPEAIGGLTDLESLSISECKWLVSLPQSLGAMAGLQKLHVSECPRLTKLPEAVAELGGLQRLEVYDCAGLKSLPESLTSRSGLVVVHYLTEPEKWLEKLKRWARFLRGRRY